MYNYVDTPSIDNSIYLCCPFRHKRPNLSVYCSDDNKLNVPEGFQRKNFLMAALLTVILCLSTSCQKIADTKVNEQNAYEKIQTLLVNLQSYQTEASVEYKSNKDSNIYETVQKCRITDEYRVEVAGPKKCRAISPYATAATSVSLTNVYPAGYQHP